MISKTLIAVTTMMIAVTADCSTIENTEHVATLQESEVLTSIPDREQIVADLMGHRMYVIDGLPGIWEFSSPADVKHANIGSSRLSGNSVEFNFTMFLVDNESSSRDAYRAETLVTYKKKNQSWELFRIQNLSFKAAGAESLIVPGNFGSDDC